MKFIPKKHEVHPVVFRLRELGARRKDIIDASGTSGQNVDNWLKGYYHPDKKHLLGLQNLLLKFETNQEKAQEIKVLLERLDALTEDH